MELDVETLTNLDDPEYNDNNNAMICIRNLYYLVKKSSKKLKIDMTKIVNINKVVEIYTDFTQLVESIGYHTVYSINDLSVAIEYSADIYNELIKFSFFTKNEKFERVTWEFLKTLTNIIHRRMVTGSGWYQDMVWDTIMNTAKMNRNTIYYDKEPS